MPAAPLVDRVSSAVRELRPGRAVLSALAAGLYGFGFGLGLAFRIARAGLGAPMWCAVALRIGFRDAAVRKQPPKEDPR